MKLRDFKLEMFFGKYEFTAPYLLTQSDCEAMELKELLAMEPGAEERFLRKWLGYTETPGDPELRELTAALYPGMAAENVLMHCGAQEAIFDYMSVMLEPSDHIITIFPTYQSLFEVALAKGCGVSKWTLKNEGNRWTLDFDELEALIKPNTKLIAVNTPSNPTGYTMTEAEIKTLCGIADKLGIYIFSDEVYKGLDLDGVTKPSVACVYDKAVTLGVLSKAYGLAGLRIGWVVSKDMETLSKMARFKHYLSICNAGPSEELAKVALKHSGRLLDRNLGIIRQNLKLANAFFAKYPKLFKNNPPQCGPIAFHQIFPGMPVAEFCEKLVQESGVLLLPPDIYDVEEPYFRMGYGRVSFPACLEKLEAYLVEQKFI